MPRPRLLDDGKQREVCALVAAGCGIEAAARYVGCNPRTIRRAAMRDAGFYEQLRQAEIAAQVTPLHALRKAAGSHWRAAAWLLERTQPDRFARRQPRTFTENQVVEMVSHLSRIISDEVADKDALKRIADRFGDFEQQAVFDAWAANAPRHDVHRRYKRMVERQTAATQTPMARVSTPIASTNQVRAASDATPPATAGNSRSDFAGRNGEVFCRP